MGNYDIWSRMLQNPTKCFVFSKDNGGDWKLSASLQLSAENKIIRRKKVIRENLSKKINDREKLKKDEFQNFAKKTYFSMKDDFEGKIKRALQFFSFPFSNERKKLMKKRVFKTCQKMPRATLKRFLGRIIIIVW